MVIRNVQELAQVRTRLINWRRFEKHVGKLLDFWCMSEPALLLYVDSVIKQMEEEIEIYERRRCTSAEETQIDLHAMQLLRHIDRTGMYLIKARVRLGWSQKELSDAAKMTSQQISRYERESYSGIALATAQRIAAVLVTESEKKQTG